MFNIKEMVKDYKGQEYFEPNYNLEDDAEKYMSDTEDIAKHCFDRSTLGDIYMSLKDVNMEGFVKNTADIIKSLWIRFKEMLSKILNVVKKAWLRTVIFFAKKDKELTRYKERAGKAIMIESTNKNALKDLLQNYGFNYKLGFITNADVDSSALHTDKDYDRIRDIIKYVKKPKSKTVDYLMGKSNASFIAIDKDAVYLTSISKESNNEKYASMYKEIVDHKYYDEAKKKMYKDIDDGDITEGVKSLFANIEPFDIIKTKLNKASSMLEGYAHRIEALMNENTSDTKRVQLRYETYNTEVKYIYYTIKYMIRQTKLGLNMGELLFD